MDDEPQIRRVVRRALEAPTAHRHRYGGRERPDMIVLDLGLPDEPRSDVCRELRAWFTAPVIVLSARHADREKAAQLDAEADD